METHTYTAESIWDTSVVNLATVVEITREPFFILNERFEVVAASELYYKLSRSERPEVEGQSLYTLEHNAFDNDSLRKSMQDVARNGSYITGVELKTTLPRVGNVVLMLSARRIYPRSVPPGVEPAVSMIFAMEDITETVSVAELLSNHISTFQRDMVRRTEDLENRLRV